MKAPTTLNATSAEPIVIRPATEADMPGKQAITAHYVQHTTSEFFTVPATLEETVKLLGEYQAEGYPYLVAVQGDTVLGFTLLGPYMFGTGGWSWTKKFTVFVHPDHLDSSIGPMLLKKLFDVLAHPDAYDKTWIGDQYRGEGKIRNLVGIVAVDEQDGKGVHDWLLESRDDFGLTLVGTKKGVGRKFDRWIDVVELQKTIE